MSYDLAGYLPEALDAEALTALVDASPGLLLEESASEDAEGSQNWHILRGKKASYCFTLEGPYVVEPEDVPHEVTAAVLGAGVMYSILVEGSDSGSIPHAVRFTKRLAKEGNGAAQDLQTDEVWPKTSNRGTAKPERNTNIDAVEVRWYHLMDEIRDDFPQRHLDLARQYLPEALPKRFGAYEPAQGNLARDGDQAFIDAFAGEYGASIFGVGTFPVFNSSFHGIFSGNKKHDHWNRKGDVQSVSISIHREVLDDPQWRDTFHRFFLAVARELRSFYASAEVNPGYLWNGRTLWSGKSEWFYTQSGSGRWKGLTDRPVWWAWFAPIYADLLRPYLKGTITEHTDGLFHSFGDKPLHRLEIIERWPDAYPWVPAEFISEATPDTQDEVAEVRPGRLAQMLVPPPPKPDWL